jgi:hypothetical protein
MGVYCNYESWKAHYVPHGFSNLPLVNLYIVDYGRTLTQRRGENLHKLHHFPHWHTIDLFEGSIISKSSRIIQIRI